MNKKHGLVAVGAAIMSLLTLDNVLDNESTRLEKVFNVIGGVVATVLALGHGWLWLNNED